MGVGRRERGEGQEGRQRPGPEGGRGGLGREPWTVLAPPRAHTPSPGARGRLSSSRGLPRRRGQSWGPRSWEQQPGWASGWTCGGGRLASHAPMGAQELHVGTPCPWLTRHAPRGPLALHPHPGPAPRSVTGLWETSGAGPWPQEEGAGDTSTGHAQQPSPMGGRFNRPPSRVPAPHQPGPISPGRTGQLDPTPPHSRAQLVPRPLVECQTAAFTCSETHRMKQNSDQRSRNPKTWPGRFKPKPNRTLQIKNTIFKVPFSPQRDPHSR